MNKLDIMFELRKRGELPANKVVILTELERRGEIPSHPPSAEGVEELSEKAYPSQISEPKVGKFGQKHPDLYAAGEAAKITAKKTAEFLGIPKITEPFARTAAYIAGDTPIEKEAVGLPTAGQFAGAGLQAGALAFPYARATKAITGVVSKALPKAIAEIVGVGGAGATGGYMLEAGDKLSRGETPTPGITTAIGAAIPTAIKAGAKVGAWAWDKIPPISKKTIERKAAEELSKTIRTPEEIKASIRDAKKVSEATGTTFRRGQIMNDEEALRIEKELMSEPSSAASRLELERIKDNEKALHDYYQKRVLKGGKEGIEDVQHIAEEIKNKFDNIKKTTEKIIEAEKLKLETGQDTQILGKNLHSIAKETMDESQKAIKKGYTAIPNRKLNSGELKGALDELENEMKSLGQDPSVYPFNVIDKMKKTITAEKPKVSGLVMPSGEPIIPSTTTPAIKDIELHDLIDFDQWTNRLIGEAKRGVIDRQYNKTLGTLKGAINNTLDKAGEGLPTVAAQAYKAIRKEAQTHAKRFYEGRIADILHEGTQSEGQKVLYSDKVAQFFKAGKGALEAADDFKRAIGNNQQANELVKDYAKYKFLQDLKDKPLTTGWIKNWTFRHKQSLEKFGLKEEFSNIQKATQSLEKAKEMADLFEQSAIAKVIGKDTNKAMQSIYSGKNLMETAKVTRAAISQLKASGNETAIHGYKNAFVEHLRNEVERKMESLTGVNKIYPNALLKVNEQYKPAIMELFKDEPRRIIALRNVQKAIEISNREGQSIYKGTDTQYKLAGWMKRYMPGKNIIPVVGALMERGKNKVNEILTEAAFNPLLADDLLRGIKGEISPHKFNDLIDKHIARATVYSEAIANSE